MTMLRWIGFLALLGVAGCVTSPGSDPHNLPWVAYPGPSAGVTQYTTSMYPSLTAPSPFAPGGRP